MNLFYQPEIPKGILHLDADESRHAIKVLRMQVGEALHVTDGTGNFYKATVAVADDRKCTFTIRETITTPPRSFNIAIAIAPTKNIDRIEWLVEKAVEVGVEEIHFMLCQNSERKTINLERLLKIAVSAMKQSGQYRLPLLHDIKPFAEIVTGKANQKFICYVDSSNPNLLKTQAQPNKHYLIMIGPEGDFRPAELELALQNGFSKVSLGPNRLRTETAALVACQTLNFINL
ncbi:MAG: 16S rRNA (uracil(1498)-N(3))-methyltransferase [Cyclobacteriaceae bacterium]|nr:16S rRNA (uracil(1498)-N(3))-methyltransferase [Cyclobacteriaceae bacterium]